LTRKKISIFGFVWFCLAFFGFNGYNLVTVNCAGINKQTFIIAAWGHLIPVSPFNVLKVAFKILLNNHFNVEAQLRAPKLL
jgi:hypothetical protein